MKRIVEPELLDELPPADPRAIQSRRDLRRVNFFMGNARGISEMLRKHFPDRPPSRIVELGAGDGTFALQIAKKLSSRWKNLEVILLDQQNLVSVETKEKFQRFGWRQKIVCADVFDWLPQSESADCVVANLFLHHFQSEKLTRLLHVASAKSKLFVACEPRRASLGFLGTKLLWLMGCNAVTRHDAEVSVRAGFRDQEISAFWPRNEKWKIEEQGMGLFSHTFVAARLGQP